MTSEKKYNNDPWKNPLSQAQIFNISWNTEAEPQLLVTTHKKRSICGSSFLLFSRTVHPACGSFLDGLFPQDSSQAHRGPEEPAVVISVCFGPL